MDNRLISIRTNGLLFVAVGMLCAASSVGCGNRYMVRDDHGRLVPPVEQKIAYGKTPFERSLYTSFDDLYDTEKIRYYIMFDLLAGLAEHEGPNSRRFELFSELRALHVLTDSTRVRRIFHDGLLVLDRRWGDPDSSYFLDVELRNRAEQIRRCGCFLPESERHFDELGRLVANLGEYEVISFGESRLIVSFPNGVHATIDLDENYEHKVINAGTDLDLLLVKRDLEALGAEANPSGVGGAKASFAVGPLADSTQLKKEEMKVYRKVAVDPGYDELPVDRINLHVIPTSYSDGRWNGGATGDAEGPWRWSRLFMDFYLNLANVAQYPTDSGRTMKLGVTYEILRLTDSGSTMMASEEIPFECVTEGAGRDDGISFRMFTQPFVSEGAEAVGDYQVNVSGNDGRRTFVRKYPFSISDRTYELMLVDKELSHGQGLPVFARAPEVRSGRKATVLIPVRGLPSCESGEGYCANVRFYLLRNDRIKNGTVRMSDLLTFAFADSSGVGAPVIPEDSERTLNVPQPIDEVTIHERFSTAYISCEITIPRRLPDGESVRPGTYSLVAMITGRSGRVAEAALVDLRIR